MVKTILKVIVLMLLAAMPLVTPPQSGTFVIERFAVAGGGVAGSGGIFTLNSSVGEAASGMTGTGGSFGVAPGFWAVASTGYSISGFVRTPSGRGITSAVASLSGGPLVQPVQIRTMRHGGFRFDNLTPGFTYTVTVSARRYTFLPDNQTVLLDNTIEGLTFTSTLDHGR
jgi:hypothetical protein